MGAGDCEDYAIAKFVALQEAGVSADDLRIVILQDDIRKEYHAVVAARLDGNWLMLDNLHMIMVEDQQVRLTTLYFSSIMTESNSTPTRHPLLRDRMDMSEA
jgi:predicted transglutaminase-like cysteine proteinase